MNLNSTVNYTLFRSKGADSLSNRGQTTFSVFDIEVEWCWMNYEHNSGQSPIFAYFLEHKPGFEQGIVCPQKKARPKDLALLTLTLKRM